jgi:hypothetical protein
MFLHLLLAVAGTLSYERALFPHGLPAIRSSFDDTRRASTFHLYAVATLPHSPLRVVLYSAGVDYHSARDNDYRVFLGLLESSNGRLRVRDRREITAQIPTFTDAPGTFFDAGGSLHSFSAADEGTIVDANVWSLLSGSGGITVGTDFFFRVERSRLVPVGSIPDTESHARGGVSQTTETWSSLFHDRSIVLVLTTHAISKQEAPAACHITRTRYELRGGSLRKVGELSAAELSALRVRLRRIRGPSSPEHALACN